MWGQVRPGSGARGYRIQVVRGGAARWLTPLRRTGSRGIFVASVRAPQGSLVRLWSADDGAFGVPVLLR